MLDLYFQFSRKVGLPVQAENLAKERHETEEEISRILKTECGSYTRKCSFCGKELSWDYPFSICERCFERGRSGRGRGHGGGRPGAAVAAVRLLATAVPDVETATARSGITGERRQKRRTLRPSDKGLRPSPNNDGKRMKKQGNDPRPGPFPAEQRMTAHNETNGGRKMDNRRSFR